MNFGHDVIHVDSDPRKIDLPSAGRIPIHEPGLRQLAAANVAAGSPHLPYDSER